MFRVSNVRRRRVVPVIGVRLRGGGGPRAFVSAHTRGRETKQKKKTNEISIALRNNKRRVIEKSRASK